MTDKQLYTKNMMRAVHFIEKNLMLKIKINDIAKACFMSKDNFWKIFKNYFNEPIGSYIRKRRLHLVAKKLIRTKNSTEKLALSSGFDSNEVFFR